jgi:hypothetical protein
MFVLLQNFSVLTRRKNRLRGFRLPANKPECAMASVYCGGFANNFQTNPQGGIQISCGTHATNPSDCYNRQFSTTTTLPMAAFADSAPLQQFKTLMQNDFSPPFGLTLRPLSEKNRGCAAGACIRQRYSRSDGNRGF